MKKNWLKNLAVLGTAVIISLSVASCGPKDADVQSAAATALAGDPTTSALQVSVKDGVATISGECKDDACKVSSENVVKGIKGVKQVVSNVTVAPPPPPLPPAAPVTISADDNLSKMVTDAIKDNAGVMASVKDGVVTLTGEIKRADLPKLMQKVQALKPKKVENKLTIK
ncbi:BON domain-containing protein [Pinibacter soli]|uniref:BON domain-containing protein n=1 Tax=Pinibacter soli TaxID=3044211 RepID=A0ABT6RJ59_9BACT|nr:BON domain-containing protein [Pinibacter soli]MDI3322461.1 BON domain-containing protein [Pinibacter soli]